MTLMKEHWKWLNEQIHKKFEHEEYGSTAFSMPDKQNPRIVCRTH